VPDAPERRVRLLFVCLGNICRSPTAEGVMRALVARDGLQESIQIDSAGTGSWHVGSAPDGRATDAARARGLVLEGAARQVSAADMEHFDLVLAMDAENARELRALAEGDEQRAKVHLLREFDPASTGDLDVPDPYYGGAGGFHEVLDLVQAACEGLLQQIRRGHVPGSSTGS
jgi:protein-tyrosine phosphatase